MKQTSPEAAQPAVRGKSKDRIDNYKEISPEAAQAAAE
jgi:hypothetical protein